MSPVVAQDAMAKHFELSKCHRSLGLRLSVSQMSVSNCYATIH